MFLVNYKYLFISISCGLLALIGSYYFFVGQGLKVDTYFLTPNITVLDDEGCNTKQMGNYNNFTESLFISTRELANCKLLYNSDYLARFISNELYFKTAPSPNNEKIILTFIHSDSKKFIFKKGALAENFNTSYDIHTRKIHEIFTGDNKYNKDEGLDAAIKMCRNNIVVKSTPGKKYFSIVKCLAKNNDGLILNYSGVSIDKIHSFSFKDYFYNNHSLFLILSALFFVFFVAVIYMLCIRLLSDVIL